MLGKKKSIRKPDSGRPELLWLLLLLALPFLAVFRDPGGLRADNGDPRLSHLHWLGQSTFRIELGNRVIYTDPFRLERARAADIILITHNHYDHCSPRDVQKIRTEKTVIIAPPDCARRLGGEVRSLKPGARFAVPGFDVRAVPAYNIKRKYHPRKNDWVGYLFEIAGTRLYLAGDTDFIPEMKRLGNVDIALLPVSGTYVMTAAEAVRAALAIRPAIAIPMHYGSIVGSRKDAEFFAAKLRGQVRVVIKNRE